MARLKRSDVTGPGITRRKRGRGFEYLDIRSGAKVTDPATLDRIRSLAIPPAYTDLWISPHPNGHLQAIGTDAAGRRQYRYHPDWRRRKDAEKFEEMLDFARSLPPARDRCRRLVAADTELTRDRVLAAAFLLLEYGFFRVGSEAYTEEHETYGLATLLKEHVAISGDEVTFDYLAKGSKRRIVQIAEPEVAAVLGQMKRRRGGGQGLLAYRIADAWHDVTSGDINTFVKQATGGDYSAKDFRTWNATVLAAVTLAVASLSNTSKAAAKRAKAYVCQQVADALGNTPTVARNSYIDPRVFDRFDSGWTIAPALELLGADVDYGLPAFHGRIEHAVLDLLEERDDSMMLEQVAV